MGKKKREFPPPLDVTLIPDCMSVKEASKISGKSDTTIDNCMLSGTLDNGFIKGLRVVVKNEKWDELLKKWKDQRHNG